MSTAKTARVLVDAIRLNKHTDDFHLTDAAAFKLIAGALDAARQDERRKFFCQCPEPYVGAQIVGSPPHCERCDREIERAAPGAE